MAVRGFFPMDWAEERCGCNGLRDDARFRLLPQRGRPEYRRGGLEARRQAWRAASQRHVPSGFSAPR